ncbi:MAG: peptidase domain protein [Parcubacteria group bacterium]|nr:peptidase domain protein [Parcubacteria group bacterium]
MFLFLLISFSALGAICGSFIGVLAERLYTGQSWKKGRSKCNSCREELGARDMVPVLSMLWYRGRCRQCGARVPAAYSVFEALMGFLFAISYVALGLGPMLLVFLLALLTLGFIVLYDLRHMIVPPQASMFLSILALLYAFLASDVTTPAGVHAFGLRILVAGLAGFGFFLLHILSRGRAMGMGDAPVVFALALLVGSQTIAGIMFSFWIGAVIGVIILLRRRGGPTMGIEVPFVPFLALGFLLAYFTQWNPLPF